MGLREILSDKLSKKELKLLRTSFDIVGSREKAVAIIEIPEELESKSRIIAEALLKVHKNVKSVLKKSSKRKGKFRLREYELIAGEEDTEVVHKESGCRFLLDPRKVYFSVRESAERERIAKEVQKGEKVLVMFGGVAPFPILIAKGKPVKKVYSVEINPYAHEYALKNVKLNKVEDKVVPLFGDVKEVCPKLKEKFDRILMPLPEEAWKYLDVAFSCSKHGTVIYLYGIEGENLEEKVREAAKKSGLKVRVVEKRKVLPYAPRRYKVCLKIKVI